MVADRGSFHTDQVVDGDVHRSDWKVAGDVGAGYGIELIAHADIGAAVEEGAWDEVVATGQDQGVGIGVVKSINKACEIRRRLRRQQAGFSIGEVQKLQAVWDREIHHRNHIVALTGGNHAAGGVGGGGEEGDPLHPLGTREDHRIHGHRGIGIGDIEDRRHAGSGAL